MKKGKKVRQIAALWMTVSLLFSSAIFMVQANEMNEILVMMQPGTDVGSIPVFHRTNSVSVLKQVQTDEGEICLLEASGDAKQAVAALKENENVLYAEENQKIYSLYDRDYQRQWGLENTGQPIETYLGVEGIDIGIQEAWKTEKGNKSVTVALLDTGIDIHHEDLQENIFHNEKEIAGDGIDNDGNGFVDDINGWDFCDNDATVSHQGTDSDGKHVDLHGTHVAGIIGAVTNGIGIQGVAQNVSILPIRILRGGDGGYLYDAIRAIQYAKQMGADVVNCSWGMYTESLILKELMKTSDMVFVCAAGNDAKDMNVSVNRQYPAAYDLENILTVAAVTNRGEVAPFSNYGNTCVDIAAPGRDIYSTIPGNSYGYLSGTSMAAPYVSAIAALLMSSAPDMENEAVIDTICKSVLPIAELSGKVSTGGIVRADRALHRVAPPPSDSTVQRYGAGVAQDDDVLYAAGGFADEFLNTASRYHADNDSWEELPPMIEKRADHVLVAVDNRIYAFGGFNGSEAARTAEMLDLTADEPAWQPIAAMPRAKYGMGYAIIGTQIYLAGGLDKTGYSNTVYAYDTQTDTWSVKAVMPEGAAFCAAEQINGKLYLFGGIDNQGARSKTLRYDPNVNTWSEGASMPGVKVMADAVAFQDKLYVFGGINNSDFKGDPFLQGETQTLASFSKAVWEYQPNTDVWTVLQDIEIPRIGGKSILWNGHISQIGGWNGSYEVIPKHYVGMFAPKHLSARTMNDATYEVSWDEVKGAAGYELEINGTVLKKTETPVYCDSYGNEDKRTYRVRTVNDLGQPGVWSKAVQKSPNGDIDDAKQYVPGTTIQDTLSADYQYKWYRIATPESGEMSLALSGIPENCIYKMFLCNATGQAVAEAQEVNGALVIDSFTISYDPYYIELYAYQGSSEQPFTLSSTLRTVASSDIPTRIFTNLAEGSHTRQMMTTTMSGEQISWGDGTEMPEIPNQLPVSANMAGGYADAVDNETEDVSIFQEETIQPFAASSDPREIYDVKKMTATLSSATKTNTHQFSVNTNNIPYGKRGKVIVEFDEKDEHNYFSLQWDYAYGNVKNNFMYYWNDDEKTAWVTGVVERGQGTQSFRVKVASKEYSSEAANHDYTLKAYLLIGDAADEDYSGNENWGISAATPISVDSVKDTGNALNITRKLDFKHDRDYYAVKLNQGDKLTITETNPVGTENGCWIMMVDSNDNLLTVGLNDDYCSGDRSLTYLAPVDGTYYFYVYAELNFYEETANPYTLELYCTTSAKYDSFEINDYSLYQGIEAPPEISRISDYIGGKNKMAQSIPFGFDNPDDKEFFRLEINKGDKVSVELEKQFEIDWDLDDFAIEFYTETDDFLPGIDIDASGFLSPIYLVDRPKGIAANSTGEKIRYATYISDVDSYFMVRIVNKKNHYSVDHKSQFNLKITKTKKVEQDAYEITFTDSFWHDVLGMPAEKFSNDYMKISNKTSTVTGKPIYNTTAYNMTGMSGISNANLDNELDVDWYRMNMNGKGSRTKKISLSSSIAGAEDNFTIVLANADSRIFGEDSGIIRHNFEANTDYYIGVTAKNWEAIKSNPAYSLVIENAPADDMSNAQEIHIGTNENYEIEHANQQRFFKFTTGDAGSYMIKTTSDKFDLSGILYDTDGKTELCRVDNMHTFGLAHTLKGNEQYYIRLTGANAEHGSFFVNIQKLEEPKDTYFKRQWYLLNKGKFIENEENINPVPKNEIQFGLDINVLPAWEYATGKGVKVGIIEEGCLIEHEDLDGQCAVSDLPPEEPQQHGTIIAGEIAAKRNGIGIVGLAYDSKMVLLRRNNGGLSSKEILALDIEEQVKKAKDEGARIINISFYLSLTENDKDIQTLKGTMKNLDNILFVAAAGNTGAEEDPSAEKFYIQHFGLPNLLVVANYQQDGALYRTSSRGDFVDIAAPGADTISTLYKKNQKNAYGFDTGGAASYAAPFVTATAALLLERHPNLSGIDMKNIITGSADVSDKISPNDVQGSRILNAYNALVYAEQYKGTMRVMDAEPMQKMDKSKINLDAYSYETNRMYLQFEDNSQKDAVLEQLRQIEGAQGMEIIDYYDFIDCYKVELPQNISKELVMTILENENITYATSNLHFIKVNE